MSFRVPSPPCPLIQWRQTLYVHIPTRWDGTHVRDRTFGATDRQKVLKTLKKKNPLLNFRKLLNQFKVSTLFEIMPVARVRLPRKKKRGQFTSFDFVDVFINTTTKVRGLFLLLDAVFVCVEYTKGLVDPIGECNHDRINASPRKWNEIGKLCCRLSLFSFGGRSASSVLPVWDIRLAPQIWAA